MQPPSLYSQQKYEHELALFKQHKFGSKNEHLTAKQIHLWDEAVEEDIAAVDLELERLNAAKTDAAAQKATANKPKRRPLPDHLHTIRIEHEPASTECACGCALRRIGEDISEKLNPDRHSSIRNSIFEANGCVINVTH